MAYLAIVSAVDGRRAGLFATAGVALGLAIIGGLAVLGLTAIITGTPWVFNSLRWVGALYLVWLAWDTYRVRDGKAEIRSLEATSTARFFWRGLITNLLNPKAAFFYIAIFPTFLEPDGNAANQIILLTIIYVSIATGIHLLLVLFAGQINNWVKTPVHEKNLRRVFSFLLLMVALWFAWA